MKSDKNIARKKTNENPYKESCFVNVKCMFVLSFGVATVIVSNTSRKVSSLYNVAWLCGYVLIMLCYAFSISVFVLSSWHLIPSAIFQQDPRFLWIHCLLHHRINTFILFRFVSLREAAIFVHFKAHSVTF